MVNRLNDKIKMGLKGGKSRLVAMPQAIWSAPSIIPVNITGLNCLFTATNGIEDDDPMSMSFAGQTWDSNSNGCSCGVGKSD